MSADGEKNAETFFNAHQKEIKRRCDALDGDLSVKHFDRVDANGLELPFVMQDQLFVLFSMSHVEFAPVTLNAKQPAFQIFGTFATREDATDHACIVRALHPDVSLLIDETHKWIVGAATPARLADSDHISCVRDTILKRELDIANRNDTEFARNVENQEVPPLIPVDPDDDIDSQDVTVACASMRKAKRLTNGVDVRRQSVVVMSILPDSDNEVSEFLMRIYGCFESDDEANRWICNVGGDHVTEYNIDIMSTCDWIYPQRLQHKHVRREVYRSTELDKIMKKHKSAPAEVSQFKKWRRDTDPTDTATNTSSTDLTVTATDTSTNQCLPESCDA